MAEKIVGRVFNNGDLKILGELDETVTSNNPMAYDANGNLLVGGELIEEVREVATGDSVSYIETSQADFNIGTLTGVASKSDGTIKLGGEVGTNFLPTPTGAGSNLAYGLCFIANEPFIFEGFTTRTTNTVSQTVTISFFQDYVEGTILTSATPTFEKTITLPINTTTSFTGFNWVIPKGKHWIGVKSGTFTGMYREFSGGTWGTHPVTSAGGAVRTVGSYRADGTSAGIANLYYLFNWNLKLVTSGNRVSQSINIGSITNVESSIINWNDTVPSGSTLTIETSIDNGTTWQPATKGGAISGITAGQNLAGKTLKIRENFTLGSSITSPSLSDLTVTINQVSQTQIEVLTIRLDGTDLRIAGFEEGVTLT
jgi:hypothetical protein